VRHLECGEHQTVIVNVEETAGHLTGDCADVAGRRDRRPLFVCRAGVCTENLVRFDPFRRNVGLKMTAEAVADGIVERERSDAALRYGVLDPACFKEDGGPADGIEDVVRCGPGRD
jgi:hypothetical protein